MSEIKKKIKKFFKFLGPGFITGASDNDPSGIATYSQSGSQFGYHQLWAALYSFPFMVVVQEICGRIGLVTGKGLSGVIRNHYSKKILYAAIAILLFANTVNIGADLGAMASSLKLIIGLPFAVLLLGTTALILILEIFITYKTYVKFLKYLALTLLAYVITAFAVKQNWGEVFISTIKPTIVWSKSYLLNIVAFLGTTISPYLFFWQSNEEVEEEIVEHKLKEMDVGKPRITERDVKKMKTDTVFGMFFSNFITFFIILTAAATLGRLGIMNVDTAGKAAEALRPIAGNFAYILFAIGIIGAGLLVVPVLAASASYACSEAFQWKEGLYKKLSQAHGFYGVITIATVVGLIINFLPIPPFKILYYAAALNGVLAPPLLILIMLISNNKKIMGERVNSRFSNILGWLITVIMAAAAIALIWSLV
ncbi:MAG: manganese transport protein [Parcubacteria group bacterium Licking1014_17]|nr:MAG: manganese transport protein [Parcubacteria group bacterium Licking1014_17]